MSAAAAPTYDDHKRAQDRIMGDLHEQFPNAAQPVLEDFVKPILDETRKKMDDGAVAGGMRPSAPAPVDAEERLEADAKVIEQLKSNLPDGVEIEARPLERRVVGTMTLDPKRGVRSACVKAPPRQVESEDTRAKRARIRALCQIPAWNERIAKAVHSQSADEMNRVFSDANKVFGHYLESYLKAVNKSTTTARAIFSQVPRSFGGVTP